MAFLPVIESYQKARGQWGAIVARLKKAWPDVEQIAPVLPMLFQFNASDYKAQLARFEASIRTFKTPPAPFYHTLAEAIDYVERTGEPLPGIPLDWVSECEQAEAGTADTVTIVTTTDADGRPIPKGTTLTVRYADVLRWTSSGKARRAP